MKKIFLLIGLIVSGVVFGQRPVNYTKLNHRYNYVSQKSDSAQIIPGYNGAPVGMRVGEAIRSGYIAIDTLNNKFYFYSDSTWWGVDGLNIYNSNGTLTGNRILTGDSYSLLFTGLSSFTTAIGSTTRLSINSTNSTLQSPDALNYFDVTNSTATVATENNTLSLTDSDLSLDTLTRDPGIWDLRWNPTTKKITYSDTALLGGKLSISDTTNMLLPYLRTTGDLPPLFTTTETSHNTTFNASNINQYEFLGRTASGSGVYSFIRPDTSVIANFSTMVRPLLSGAGIISYNSVTGVFTGTEVDGSVSNELQTISVTGTTTGITTLSNSGGSMTIAGAGINTVGVSGSTITITGTEADGSITNELQTISLSGTTTVTNTLSNSGGSWTLTGAGIASISRTGNDVTVTATEVGTVQSVSATDGNGFDFTVANGTSTANISVTTTVADTRLIYSNAGAVAGVSGVTSDGTNVTAGSNNLRATSPRITTGINDANGNELFLFTATGSAVNEFTVVNGATGVNPTFSATGGDTHVGIDFLTKGTGSYNLLGNTTQAAELRLYEDTDNGTEYTSFKVGSQTSNVQYTLPTGYAAVNGYVLSSTTAGVMSWGGVDTTLISNFSVKVRSLFSAGTGLSYNASTGQFSTASRFGVSGEDATAGQNRSFDHSTYSFDIVNNSASNAGLSITQSGSYYGLSVTSQAGYAGFLSSNAGPSVMMSGTSGADVVVITTAAAISPALTLKRQSSITAQVGTGLSIVSTARNSASAYDTTMVLQSTILSNGSSTFTSHVDILGKDTAVQKRFLNIQPDGIVRTNNDADTLATRAYSRSIIPSNPRYVPVADSTTSTSSLTINSDAVDIYVITAQAADITINAPTGTLYHGKKIILQIEDNGTKRGITWNSVFAGRAISLPIETIANKVLTYGFYYDDNNDKWVLLAYDNGG